MTHTGHYSEIAVPVADAWEADRLIYQLSERGFDGFFEDDGVLKAYIPTAKWHNSLLEGLTHNDGRPLRYTLRRIAPQNWNSEWEKHFPPVTIDGRIHIRAAFHPPAPKGLLEILITPKMSFGTGHHETTELMIRLLADTDLSGKTLIDMGSGTGVLAIQAEKTCAEKIFAIDNDEWAYENMKENIRANGCRRIQSFRGGSEVLEALPEADVFLANINLNIILDNLPFYMKKVKRGGRLILSGFYETDLPAVRRMLPEDEWEPGRRAVKNRWIGIEFVRK